MKNFAKDLAKSYVSAAVIVMGYLTRSTVWNSGLGEKVEEVTRKHFNKNGES